MARAKSDVTASPVPDPRWSRLTWDDLDAWAGGRSVSRGRTYQHQQRVKDLVISGDHRLLATVMGGRRYVVSVGLIADPGHDDPPLESICTCPVGSDGCKHAVAVVAEYLDRLNRDESVPLAEVDDVRWAKLENDDGFDEEDETDSDEDEEFRSAKMPTERTPNRRSRNDWDEKIKQSIHAKSREELAGLVCALVKRFPELHEEFRERIALADGDVDRLIAQTRKELHRITGQDGWRNSWTGEGHTPNYGNLRHRLERLTELGHADAVVRLGREFLKRGLEQVGRSNDEGETAMGLGESLPVIFDALARSSLTPSAKLLFVIDAFLADDYDVIGDAANAIMDASYEPEVWSSVADDLARRLYQGSSKRRASCEEDDAKDDGSARSYHRDQITNWLARSLSHADRADELLAIYESEARKNNGYERLVRFLIEKKRYEDAKRWATEGIERTAEKWPGIASTLAGQLCEIARMQKQWDIVAAHSAHLFFQSPDCERFHELIVSAGKAGCQEPVRVIAQRFLETGHSPIQLSLLKKNKRHLMIESGWPLPAPDYLAQLWRSDRYRQTGQPHYDVLIDLAIADKRPDEVLRWYDQSWEAKKSSEGHSWFNSQVPSDRVAEAVVSSHPRRAIEIYRTQIDQHLKQANVGEYELVASYLRRMKPILKSIKGEAEWMELVHQIRERHRNRPKLLEILDRLETKPIVLKGRNLTRR